MPDRDRFGGSERDYSRPTQGTPIQSGGSRGEFSDRLYTGTNPFIQPIQTGGRQGEFSQGIFGGNGSSAYAANDIVDAIMGGMNRSQQDAGFEVAGMSSDDRTEKKLWGLAVNSFPPGTPDMHIQQKWNELKEEYYRRKYGGGSDPGDLGLTLPGRDDIVGLS